MRRVLLGLALAFAAAAAADRALAHLERSRRDRESVLRPFLADGAGMAAKVTSFEVQEGAKGRRWRFEVGASTSEWRSADYHQVFARTDAVTILLEGILKGLSTPAGKWPRDAGRFGLTDERALNLRFRDAAGKDLIEVDVGRNVPGGVPEAWMHAQGARTIDHVLAEPRSGLDFDPSDSRPPLADPFLLPRAVSLKDPSRVAFDLAGFPVREAFRVQLSSMPPLGPMREQPTVEWRARMADGSVRALDLAAAASFAAFIHRLRWEEVLDPSTPFRPAGRLVLSDDQGARSVLEFSRPGPDGVLARNAGTKQVFRVAARKVPFLFPPLETLTTRPSQEKPSPFWELEPHEGLSISVR